jgi:hypothetical protein
MRKYRGHLLGQVRQHNAKLQITSREGEGKLRQKRTRSMRRVALVVCCVILPLLDHATLGFANPIGNDSAMRKRDSQ